MNKKYIGVVTRNSNGDLSFRRETLSKDYEDLKKNLENMCNNPNRTVLDLQSEFSRVFDTWQYFGLCLPYSYSSSYVEGSGIPKAITYDEYQVQVESKKKELINEYRTFRNPIYSEEEYVEEELEDYNKNIKNSYYFECARFIDAYNFNKTSNLVKSNADTVMFSTEDIGWTTYEYPVNDDVVIIVKTNFGYGCASYFFLGMKYKGIEVLPYSAYVNYYKANVVEIMRHTRQYSTYLRDSWNVALDFVVETANLAKNAPEEFVNKFLFNEVKEMYDGLVNYMENPGTQLDKFIAEKKRTINGFCYMGTDINWGNLENVYTLYPNEMLTVFKAEKLSGALMFLNKLNELVPFFPQMQNYIDGISNLNIKLRPEVEEMMGNIRVVLEQVASHFETEKKKLSELNEKMKPYLDELNLLLSDKTISERGVIEKQFETDNPKYLAIKEIKEAQDEIVKRIETEIRTRTNLLDRLKICVGCIESHFAA